MSLSIMFSACINRQIRQLLHCNGSCRAKGVKKQWRDSVETLQTLAFLRVLRKVVYAPFNKSRRQLSAFFFEKCVFHVWDVTSKTWRIQYTLCCEWNSHYLQCHYGSMHSCPLDRCFQIASCFVKQRHFEKKCSQTQSNHCYLTTGRYCRLLKTEQLFSEIM